MNYAKAIKTIRGVKGLSQKDLALLIGKSPGYISKIESGVRVPATEVIEDICKELGIPYYLFALLASEKDDINKLPKKETKILAESLLGILTESQRNAR
jgi:transcriptional regulator with XRE-family HTH domain